MAFDSIAVRHDYNREILLLENLVVPYNLILSSSRGKKNKSLTSDQT